MRRSEKFKNPFYGLLLVAGIAFVLTAVVYGVMATREVAAARANVDAAEPHPLMQWMSQHGDTAIIVELVFLALCTFGAIGTDDYWQRRAAAQKKQIVDSRPSS